MKETSSVQLFSSARYVNVESKEHLNIPAEMIVVDEGSLNMTVGDTEYVANGGEGVFVLPFEMHSFTSKSFNRCHVIMYSKIFTEHFNEFWHSHTPESRVFKVSEESAGLIDKILPHRNNTATYFEAQAILSSLALDVVRTCRASETKHSFGGAPERVLEYVGEHLTEALSLRSVASAVGMHPVTLSNLFAERIGSGFNRSIKLLRCNYAAKMLKGSDATVTEIAYLCGFGSIRSFNRCFKEVYDATPTKYREMNEFV